jgi:hypothetical protein
MGLSNSTVGLSGSEVWARTDPNRCPPLLGVKHKRWREKLINEKKLPRETLVLSFSVDLQKSDTLSGFIISKFLLFKFIE